MRGNPVTLCDENRPGQTHPSQFTRFRKGPDIAFYSPEEKQQRDFKGFQGSGLTRTLDWRDLDRPGEYHILHPRDLGLLCADALKRLTTEATLNYLKEYCQDGAGNRPNLMHKSAGAHCEKKQAVLPRDWRGWKSSHPTNRPPFRVLQVLKAFLPPFSPQEAPLLLHPSSFILLTLLALHSYILHPSPFLLPPSSFVIIAVGTPVAGCPPHRSVREALPHTPPTSDG